MKPGAFLAQVWNGSICLYQIESISLADARQCAIEASAAAEITARVMAMGRDYCEVYEAGAIRTGTFAQTTLVSEAA